MQEHEQTAAETPADETTQASTPVWQEAYRSTDIHWDPLRAIYGLPAGSLVVLEVDMRTGTLRVKG